MTNRSAGSTHRKKPKLFRAKYPGECKQCGESFPAGCAIQRHSGGGYCHEDCGLSADAECSAGVADYNRWKRNTEMFGDEYAAAEELAWAYRTGEF